MLLIYKSVKESIFLQGQLNAKQSAEEFNKFMISSTNSILLTAYTLNNMIESNANKLYRPLHHIMGASFLAVILSSFVILIVFVNITRKNLNFKDLYKLADQCTYTSKKKDGNAVTFYKK